MIKDIIGITGQILVRASCALSTVSMLNFLKINVLCLSKRVFLGDAESSTWEERIILSAAYSHGFCKNKVCG